MQLSSLWLILCDFHRTSTTVEETAGLSEGWITPNDSGICSCEFRGGGKEESRRLDVKVRLPKLTLNTFFEIRILIGICLGLAHSFLRLWICCFSQSFTMWIHVTTHKWPTTALHKISMSSNPASPVTTPEPAAPAPVMATATAAAAAATGARDACLEPRYVHCFLYTLLGGVRVPVSWSILSSILSRFSTSRIVRKPRIDAFAKATFEPFLFSETDSLSSILITYLNHSFLI